MSDQAVRWAIMGTASIARKNWKSIWNAENANLVAVASRDSKRADAFIDECQRLVPFATRPEAVAGYESLLARQDIDAVYIPLPTGIRKEWVIRAAESGKHVLCEKPCGCNTEEVQAMVDACRRNHVQFMDGVMFMHSARLSQLRQVLDDGKTIGQLKRISTHFSFLAADDFRKANIRVSSELEPLGCLGDLGWYNIRFILWALGWKNPTSVTGRILAEHGRGDSPAAVPMEFSGELFFSNGASASFYCSFVTEHQQWVHLSGTRGFLTVPDFVLPYFGGEVAFETNNPSFEQFGSDFNMVSHARRIACPEYSSGFPRAQETNLIRNFSQIVCSGQIQPVWSEIALQTQRVMDACLRSARQGSAEVGLPTVT